MNRTKNCDFSERKKVLLGFFSKSDLLILILPVPIFFLSLTLALPSFPTPAFWKQAYSAGDVQVSKFVVLYGFEDVLNSYSKLQPCFLLHSLPGTSTPMCLCHWVCACHKPPFSTSVYLKCTEPHIPDTDNRLKTAWSIGAAKKKLLYHGVWSYFCDAQYIGLKTKSKTVVLRLQIGKSTELIECTWRREIFKILTV